jgi:hypothetical protein
MTQLLVFETVRGARSPVGPDAHRPLFSVFRSSRLPRQAAGLPAFFAVASLGIDGVPMPDYPSGQHPGTKRLRLMDFDLSEELACQATARDFARAGTTPYAGGRHEDEVFPLDALGETAAIPIHNTAARMMVDALGSNDQRQRHPGT